NVQGTIAQLEERNRLLQARLDASVSGQSADVEAQAALQQCEQLRDGTLSSSSRAPSLAHVVDSLPLPPAPLLSSPISRLCCACLRGLAGSDWQSALRGRPKCRRNWTGCAPSVPSSRHRPL